MSRKNRASKTASTEAAEQTAALIEAQANASEVLDAPAPAPEQTEKPKLRSKSIVPVGYRERCVIDKEHKTAGGNPSVHNGDALAVFLRGKSLEQVFELASKHLEGGGALRAKYAHLNPGQQRMNVGNRLRSALKDGLWAIPQ